MLSGDRLLIIEDVFLIALDIQRALEEANALHPVFARDFEEAAGLMEQFDEFDLAIVNPPRRGSAEMEIAERLAAAGPAIGVCTAAPIDLSGTGLMHAEMISKPFRDDDLMAACRRALDKRRR